MNSECFLIRNIRDEENKNYTLIPANERKMKHNLGSTVCSVNEYRIFPYKKKPNIAITNLVVFCQ